MIPVVGSIIEVQLDYWPNLAGHERCVGVGDQPVGIGDQSRGTQSGTIYEGNLRMLSIGRGRAFLPR